MIVKRTSSLAGVHSEQDGFFSPAPPSRIYSHITIYVPGRGRLTVTCASLEGASLATSQEIDQMLALIMCLSDYKAGTMTYTNCTEAKLRISLSQVSTSLGTSTEDTEARAAPLG